MSTTDSKNLESFDEYNWEEDEGWHLLIRNLEFPPEWSDDKKEKFLMKKKKKYFKKLGGNVPETPKEPLPPKNEEKSPEKENVSESQAKVKPEPSTSSSGSSKKTSDSKPKTNNPSYRPRSSTNKLPIITQFTNLFYLFCQWFALVNGLVSAIYKPCFKICLYTSIIMHLGCIFQTNGLPKFNMYYAQRIMQDSNTMILIYAAIFLMGPSIFVFLCPLLLRNFWMGCYLLNGVGRLYLPPSIFGKYQPKLKQVIHNQGWYLRNIGLLEVCIGLLLIPMILFVKRSFLLTVIYWQIMHAKYMMDEQIKIAFRTVNGKILQYVSRVPVLLNLYTKLTGILWNMVDPVKLQQQMQQGQRPGGIMSKFCTIM